MALNEKDRYVDMLSVVIKALDNLKKPRGEWCPCAYHRSDPVDKLYSCGDSWLFHSPELLTHMEYEYVLGCMNSVIEKNPTEYKQDAFFIELAQLIIKTQTTPVPTLEKVKEMLYTRINM